MDVISVSRQKRTRTWLLAAQIERPLLSAGEPGSLHPAAAAVAAAAALKCLCVRRCVGAVIKSGSRPPLSTGVG